MNNLNQVVYKYVNGKSTSWADSTIHTAYAKLCVVDSQGLEPERLYTALKTRGLSDYTIKSYFILAQCFEEETKKTSKIREWLQNHKLKFKNCYKKKLRSLTEEQFDAALKAAPLHLYNFLVLMGKAGLRKSEAFNVSWSDIKDGMLEVRAGKGGKQRFVPFDRKWLRGDTGEVGVVVVKNLQYAKFFSESLTGFTPHDCRVYYATKVVNIVGMSIEDARDLLGHSDIKTTAKYLRASKDKQHRLIMENF